MIYANTLNSQNSNVNKRFSFSGFEIKATISPRGKIFGDWAKCPLQDIVTESVCFCDAALLPVTERGA
jgi:hypothetical protein